MGLINVMIINKEKNKESLDLLTYAKVYGTSTPRGRIYDRNHNLLVDNKSLKTIIYQKKKGTTNLEMSNYAYERYKNLEALFNWLDSCDQDAATNANLTCSLDLMSNTKTTNLTFKDNEVTIGNKSLYLISLNKIQFAYSNSGPSESPDSSDTDNKNGTFSQRSYLNSKKGSDHKAVIISVSIVAVVVVIGGLLAIWLYLSKIKKAKALSVSENVKVASNQDDSGATNIDMIKN